MIESASILRSRQLATRLSILAVIAVAACLSCGSSEQTTVQELVAIVDDPSLAKTDRSKVVDAILELGERRATGAVPTLSEKLDFHINAGGLFLTQEIPAPEIEYPAVQALLSIGEPSVPGIADALALRIRSETFVVNALYTVMEILDGNKPARKALREHAAKQDTPEKRKRLEGAAAQIPIVVDPDANATTPRWK